MNEKQWLPRAGWQIGPPAASKQTSLFCLQETVGICQTNKENITFRAAHKTWNAIYRKGSFQNMAVHHWLTCREQWGWRPPVLRKSTSTACTKTVHPHLSGHWHRAGKSLPALRCHTEEMLEWNVFFEEQRSKQVLIKTDPQLYIIKVVTFFQTRTSGVVANPKSKSWMV